MPPDIGIAAASVRALASVFKRASEATASVRAERRAARGDALNESVLDSNFQASLDRLTGIEENRPWWDRLVTSMGHSLVAPAAFELDAIKGWLKKAVVQSDIKALAKQRFENPEHEYDRAVMARLCRAYAVATGETDEDGVPAVDTVCNILVASVRAKLSVEGQIVVELQQATLRQLGAITAIRDDPTHTSVCTERLETLLRLRGVSDTIYQRLQKLAGDVQDGGSLQFAAHQVKNRVLYWTVRIGIGLGLGSDTTGRYEGLLDESALTSSENAVLRALRSYRSKDFEAALSTLRDVDSADARTNIFFILSRTAGNTAALDWYGSLRPADLSAFTAVGWRSISATLAVEDRWDEAISVLEALPVSVKEQYPAIFLLEASLRTGKSLPKDLRKYVLNGPVLVREATSETPEAVADRRAALQLFRLTNARFGEQLPDVAASARASEAWLLLLDPATAHTGMAIVQEMLQHEQWAYLVLPLVRVFGMRIDTSSLDHYLTRRRLTGGMSDPDRTLEFNLALYRGSSAELVDYLTAKRDELIGKVLTRAEYAGQLASALIDQKKLDEAEMVLVQHAEELGEDSGRLHDLIRITRGEDVGDSLLVRFQKTASDIDLQNLCVQLRSKHDYPALRGYATELFRRQPNGVNARVVVECLTELSLDRELVEFLEAHEALGKGDRALERAKTWALIKLGRLGEAKAALSAGGAVREPADVVLAINVALHSGSWSEFPVLLEKAKLLAADFSPTDLIRVALMASHADAEGAFELAKVAVSRAKDDPAVLVGAYSLSLALGKEEVASEWFARAVSLSSDEGPVWKKDIRDVRDLLVENKRRSDEIWKLLAAAQIPVHLAIDAFHKPISLMLVAQARANEREADARRRVLLPVRAAKRLAVSLAQAQSVAMDVSALMIATSIELVPDVLKRFKTVYLPATTFPYLLREKTGLRHHQPSRIAEAKRLLRLVEQRYLSRLERPEAIPAQLEEEAGEIAWLLTAAKANGGLAVVARPVYKQTSLMEETVDLSAWEGATISTKQFVRLMQRDGRLSEAQGTAALDYLRKVDEGPESIEELNELASDQRLLLDSLTVTYLFACGILEACLSATRPTYIPPSVVDESTTLVHTESDLSSVEAAVNALAHILKNGVDAGTIRLLPWTGREKERLEATDALQEMLVAGAVADAVWIDDRSLSHHQFVDGGGITRPLVTVSDILEELVRAKMISAEDRFDRLQSLRKGMFALIPIEHDEFAWWLSKCKVLRGDSTLRETRELIVLREYQNAVRARLSLTHQERDYLGDLLRTAISVVQSVWTDEGIAVDLAQAQSAWMVKYVLNLPWAWFHALQVPPPASDEWANAHAAAIGGFLVPMSVSTERLHQYMDWVQRELLEPLGAANPGVLDRLSTRIADMLVAPRSGPQGTSD